MLTQRQKDLLAFLTAEAGQGRCPSFAEMQDVLALGSKSGVHRLLTALEERGFIRRLHNRVRAIELTGNPAPISHKAPTNDPTQAPVDVVLVPLYTLRGIERAAAMLRGRP